MCNDMFNRKTLVIGLVKIHTNARMSYAMTTKGECVNWYFAK